MENYIFILYVFYYYMEIISIQFLKQKLPNPLKYGLLDGFRGPFIYRWKINSWYALSCLSCSIPI